MSATGLSYQNLRVYEDMVQFIAAAEQHVSTWDRAHAVVDHFYRASEGSLVCLRKSWQASGVHEESPEYADGHPFNHERLEIANLANTRNDPPRTLASSARPAATAKAHKNTQPMRIAQSLKYIRKTTYFTISKLRHTSNYTQKHSKGSTKNENYKKSTKNRPLSSYLREIKV